MIDVQPPFAPWAIAGTVAASPAGGSLPTSVSTVAVFAALRTPSKPVFHDFAQKRYGTFRLCRDCIPLTVDRCFFVPHDQFPSFEKGEYLIGG